MYPPFNRLEMLRSPFAIISWNKPCQPHSSWLTARRPPFFFFLELLKDKGETTIGTGVIEEFDIFFDSYDFWPVSQIIKVTALLVASSLLEGTYFKVFTAVLTFFLQQGIKAHPQNRVIVMKMV